MFEKNLSYLNNVRLKEELKNIPITSCISDIGFVNTANGNVVFMKGEIPTDDTIDPIGYAKSLITPQMKEFQKNDVIISVGIGVGYILDELFNTVQSKIVIYEPDTKFLRFIFETVDLTPYLQNDRVFISDDINECINYILKNYLNDDKIEFAISQILSIFYKDDIEQFTEQLYARLRNKIVDINTIKKLSKRWVYNVIQFINLDRKFYSIEDFKWKFTGKNALILGAGPSLKDNIEKIKENRDKFTIFAVNKTLKILEDNNIIPDFTVFADAAYLNKWYDVSEEFTTKLNVIADWKSDFNIAKLKSNKHITYFSDNEIFLKKYAKELEISLFPSEQTTTLIALMCANYMDFEKIYFCGMDLAFKDNIVYYDDRTVDIQNDKAVIDVKEKQIVEVQSIKGAKIKTREDYAIFIKTLETIIKTRGLKNLYNITEFGALIEGMKYTSFDNINIYGTKPNIELELENIKLFDKDFKKCLEKEKAVMINIHENIIKRSPVSLVTKKIVNDSTLLYEYLQLELIELSRNIGQNDAVDNFYSKCILAIDKLLAIMP